MNKEYELILTDYIIYTSYRGTYKEMERYLLDKMTLKDENKKNISDIKNYDFLEGGTIKNIQTQEEMSYYNLNEKTRELYKKYKKLYYSFLYE